MKQPKRKFKIVKFIEQFESGIQRPTKTCIVGYNYAVSSKQSLSRFFYNNPDSKYSLGLHSLGQGDYYRIFFDSIPLD